MVTLPESVDSVTAHSITQPGVVQFRPVLRAYPIGSGQPGTTQPPLTPVTDAADPGARDQVVVLAQVDPKTRESTAILELGPVLLDGTALSGATASKASTGRWEVNPVFKDGPDGITALNAAAATCFAAGAVCPQVGSQSTHGQLALVLDGQVLAAPSIDAPSFTRDQIRISGAFTEASAKTIAALLSSGPLPAVVTTTAG